MAGKKATTRGAGASAARGVGRRRGFFDYPRSGRGPIRRWVPSLRFLIGSFLFCAALGIGVVLTAYATTTIPDVGKFTTAQATTIYYSDGKTVMGRFAEFDREIIDNSEIPQHMKDAIVAAEDRTFYDNAGVSPTGIARALWVNVKGGSRQGGSTITQQYAERYFLGETLGYVGKFKEALLALKLAQDEDKETILGNYLNTIYFGRGAYGIERAAQAYFGVKASKLTVAQSALIAGVVPSPSRWDPRFSPDKAKDRWEYVVDGMVATGTLTQAERDELKYPKAIKYKESNTLGGPKGYIIDMAKAEVLKRSAISPDELVTRGLKIVTTIDKDVQKAAVAAIRAMPEDTPKGLQTALVAVAPKSGAIRSMYAGEDFVEVQRNRVTQDVAQAGSTFKPFTLVAALEKGITLESRYNGNSGRSFEGFTKPVANFGNVNFGNVSLLKATEDSVNTAYVELNLEVTPEATRDVAIRAGIPSETMDFDPFPNNVLGVASVHPLDMASAYATFAGQGIYAPPYLVESVTELDGTAVYESGEIPKRVFEEDVMAETSYALSQVVEKGSGKTALALGRPAAGKTGTSSANKSAWFVGFTPELATAVTMYQIGKDGSQDSITPFGGFSEITGGSVPISVWTDFMTKALEGSPIQEFPARPGAAPVRPRPTPAPTKSESPSAEPTTEEPTTEAPPESPTVPSGLVGRSENSARKALTKAGLDPIVRFEDSDAEKGTVIRVEPGEGSQVPEGSSIVLVVSNGPAAKPEKPVTPPKPDPVEPTKPPAEPEPKPTKTPDKPGALPSPDGAGRDEPKGD